MTVSGAGGGGTILGVMAVTGGGSGAGVVGAASVRDGSAATLAFTGFSATGLLLVVSILLLVGGVLLLGLGRRHSARRVDQRT